jgi:hypothetical protein
LRFRCGQVLFVAQLRLGQLDGILERRADLVLLAALVLGHGRGAFPASPKRKGGTTAGRSLAL